MIYSYKILGLTLVSLSLSLPLRGALKPRKPISVLNETAQEAKVNTSPIFSQPTGEFAIADMFKIVRELEEYKDLENEMRTEDEKKKHQLEAHSMQLRKLQEEMMNMSSTIKNSVKESKLEEGRKLQKIMEVEAQTYEESRNRRAQELQMQLVKKIEGVAEEIRKERGFKAIFAGATLAYDSSIDVSGAIAQRLNDVYRAKKARQEKPAADTKKPSLKS